MLVAKLPEGVTMQFYLRPAGAVGVPGKLLFSSAKKWLHPLFELEEFLAAYGKGGRDFSTCEFGGELFLRDRVVGRAAAFLIVRMGIRRVETDILSRRAIPLLQENSVATEAIATVDAIDCMTEDLLKDKSNPQEVYALLAERRKKALDKIKTPLFQNGL